MRTKALLGLFLAGGLLLWGPGASGSGAAIWPLAPTNQVHALGNGWGEYQNYGGSPYFHPGIDVMALTDIGVPCYAVARGWVKAWLTTSAGLHWRLAIADSSLAYRDSCEGWLYAHLDPNRPHKAVGDLVNPGDQIGYLVYWTVSGFDHTHFARVRDSGATWGRNGQADWAFVEAPLNLVTPNTDAAIPILETAITGSKFAYCRNNTSTYLSYTNLSGDVDIVARIYDKFGVTIPGHEIWERLNPYKIQYAIHPPGGSAPRTLSFLFGHFLPWDDVSLVNTVFKDDATCNTQGDYSNRAYYYIVTNTDGDSTLEVRDTSGTWRTRNYPNGQYWVVVYASDQYGTTTPDSQLVTVNNPVGVEEGPETAVGEFVLEAQPNPFREDLEVRYGLPQGERVSLEVYNAAGQAVRTLVDAAVPPGLHQVHWDRRTREGREVGAGIYFLRLRAGPRALTRRVLLLR